jgi:lipopolysaccharide export system protein LptC
MLRASSWLPLAILAMLAALTGWLSMLVQAPPEAPRRTRQDADAVIERFAARALDEEGRVRYRVAAARAHHYPDEDSSQLESVRLDAYRPGEPDLMATANKGEMLQGTTRVTLRDDVVVVSAEVPGRERLTLRTAVLTALPGEGKLTTRSRVDAESPSMRATAEGMDYDHASRLLKLYRVNFSYLPKKAP